MAFYTNFVISTKQKLALDELSQKELVMLRTQTSWTGKFQEIFGAEKPEVGNIGVIRGEIQLALDRKKKLVEVKGGSLMTSVWQTKVDVSMKSTSTVEGERSEEKKELIIDKKDGTKIETGLGPVVTVESPLSVNLQYPIYFLASFIREEEKNGYVLVFGNEPNKRFPGVELSALHRVVEVLNHYRSEAKRKEGSSGWEMIERMASLLNTMTMADRVSLSDTILLNVFKYVQPAGRGKVKVPSKPPKGTMGVMINKEPKLIWKGPLDVSLSTQTTENLKKGTDFFSKQMPWIQDFLTMLGASCVEKLVCANGLYPSLSQSEAKIIRYVSVVMGVLISKEKEKEEHPFLLEGEASQLNLLYTSLKSYFFTTKKCSSIEAAEMVKARFYFQERGLSKSNATQLRRYFRPYRNPLQNFVYVCWNPKAYTPASTSSETRVLHENYYEEVREIMSKATSSFVFREVLFPSLERKYYVDGYPNMFTCWDCSEEMKPATLENDKYGQESLMEVSAEEEKFYKTMRSCLSSKILSPFKPSVKRSARIMVVKGDKRLVVEINDNGDSYDLGSYDIDMEVAVQGFEEEDPGEEEEEEESREGVPDSEQEEEVEKEAPQFEEEAQM